MTTPAQFITELLAQVGKPYVYGGDGPDSFDCSGLVQYCLTTIGIKGCPRTSEAQWPWCTPVSLARLQPGDLIFEQWPGDDASPGHVCVFYEPSKVIEAPHTGDPVWVRDWSPTETTIVGYGRVPGLVIPPMPKPVTTVSALIRETNGDYRVVCPKCKECFDVMPTP